MYLIQIKRIYEPLKKSDGYRMLVDRLWPRGIKKEDAGINEWNKLLAPSAGLRKWYGYVPEKFTAFEKKYLLELQAQSSELERIAALSKLQNITLLYAAKDEQHNQAIVLQKLLNQYQ